MIRVLNTRATIEDFYEGKIGEIIFEEWGEDKNFVIFDKAKIAQEIGRFLCDEYDRITDETIEGAIDDTFDDIKMLLKEYVIEYIRYNFEGDDYNG